MRRVMRVASLLVAGASLVVAQSAFASGLYFSDRGVRPMGRAGAFVAGADDLGAIWYNPAGLADAGTSFLADFSWLRFNSEYTRRLKLLDADNTVRYVDSPTVRGASPIIPFPTIAGSYAFGDKKQFTFAAGIYAPYVALATYPATVNGLPSPARYSLGSFDGSLLITPGIWLAYKPIPSLRFGLGLQALTGIFQSTVVFSASPQDRLLGAPEQPEFDASSQLRVGPIFAPSASAGVIFEPERHVRFGASGQLPTIVSAPAKVHVRLPSDVAFDGARIAGEDAHVRFELPAIARVGVEVRPTDHLRVELTYVREFWTTHHAIDETSKSISINGVKGLPPSVLLPAISYPRNFENSSSVRLGAEYTVTIGGYVVDLRGGGSYETSAIPPAYLSLQTVDLDKVTASLGGSLHIGAHWRFDAVYAHIFAMTQTVTPEDAKIPRVNPLNGNAPFEAVNGGTYKASADLLGVGLNYLF